VIIFLAIRVALVYVGSTNYDKKWLYELSFDYLIVLLTT